MTVNKVMYIIKKKKNMEDLRKLSFDYAEKNASEILVNAVAKAYEDGYRDGYRARESELPVNILDGTTEYVDLGLPSGTLWSKNYEREGDDLKCLPYDTAITYNIPTRDQWNELYENCDWDFLYIPFGNISKLKEVICIGPNGKSIHFPVFGIKKPSMREKERHCMFWINELNCVNNNHGRKCVDMRKTDFIDDKKGIFKAEVNEVFSGHMLPLRLVRHR